MDPNIIIPVFVLLCTILLLFKFRKTQPYISAIVYYPVKSCKPIHLTQAQITSEGLAFDRQFGFFNNENKLVDLMTEPRLIQITAEINLQNPKYLTLKHPKVSDFILNLSMEGPSFRFKMHEHGGSAQHMGPEAAKWISAVLDGDYFLGKIDTTAPEADLKFYNSSHVHIMTQESYNSIYQQLPEYKQKVIDIISFRPNIIISNSPAFDEDTWAEFSIGEVVFGNTRMAIRCREITVDAATEAHDPHFEPLKTLRRVHGRKVKGFLGLWTNVLSPGNIKINDTVKIIKRQPSSITP